MNIACPRARAKDGMERLKKGMEAYRQYMARRC